MSRFTMAAVAEMMDYRNLSSYDTPVQTSAGAPAEQPEAESIVGWFLENQRKQVSIQ